MLAHVTRQKGISESMPWMMTFGGVSVAEQAAKPHGGSSAAVDTTCGYLT